MEAVTVRACQPGIGCRLLSSRLPVPSSSKAVPCRPVHVPFTAAYLPRAGSHLDHSGGTLIGLSNSASAQPLSSAARRRGRRQAVCQAHNDNAAGSVPEETQGNNSSKPELELYENEEGELILVESGSVPLKQANQASTEAREAANEIASKSEETPDAGASGSTTPEAAGANKDFVFQVHIPRPPSISDVQQMWQGVLQRVRHMPVAGWLVDLPAAQQRRKLERLEAAAEEDPRNSEKEAAYLLELNKASPAAVVERFEKGEHAADSIAVAEYLRALIKTDTIARYLPDDKAGKGATLPALLDDLRARASGDSPVPTPGLSEALPLHVVVKSERKVETGGARIFQAVVGKLMLASLAAFLWVLAAAWIRKNVSLSVSQTAAGGAATAGNYAPKEYNKESLPEKSVKTFKDVKGCDEAKAELEEIVEYLKSPAKFTRLGGKLPKGVLLTGPPGTGKTLLAKAIAGEAGVPFFYRAGSEFEEMFVGVGAKRVRALFQAAKKKAPCIVFIDEIDAVGGSRKQWESQTRKTLNQLLVEMDGFESSDGIIVLAATNLPETLDAALTRPGRFDRHVAVPNPDIRGRTEILTMYLAGKPVSRDVDIGMLARGTVGFSGADLANLVNVAAVKAAVDGLECIAVEQLEFAKDKILMGAERKSAVLSEESRKLTAYHESGHAVVAIHTVGAQPIHKATITPRGNALGMVTQLPDKDEDSVSMRQMLARLDVCMGGRVAEEMIFGPDKVTSGARSDLKQATNLARHMVMECGMSDVVGPIFLAESPGGDFQRKVDSEVMRLLKEAYARVRALLAKHESDLHKMAQALLDRETLTSKEIQDLMHPQERVGDIHEQGVKLPAGVT